MILADRLLRWNFFKGKLYNYSKLFLFFFPSVFCAFLWVGSGRGKMKQIGTRVNTENMLYLYGRNEITFICTIFCTKAPPPGKTWLFIIEIEFSTCSSHYVPLQGPFAKLKVVSYPRDSTSSFLSMSIYLNRGRKTVGATDHLASQDFKPKGTCRHFLMQEDAILGFGRNF